MRGVALTRLVVDENRTPARKRCAQKYLNFLNSREIFGESGAEPIAPPPLRMWGLRALSAAGRLSEPPSLSPTAEAKHAASAIFLISRSRSDLPPGSKTSTALRALGSWLRA